MNVKTAEMTDEQLESNLDKDWSDVNNPPQEGTNPDVPDNSSSDDPDANGDDTPPSSDEQGDQDPSKETPKSIQKLLSKRNEDRARISELEQEKEGLSARIKELEGKSELTVEEKDSLVDARLDQKLNDRDLQFEQKLAEREREKEFDSFMKDHPELSQHKDDFRKAKDNNPNLSVDDIHLIWMKENDPQGLADKLSGKKGGYGVVGSSNVSTSSKSSASDMSDGDLESEISSLHKSGALQF